MPCLDPQTPQDGVLTNKRAGIQGFVEANLLLVETHFRVGVFFILLYTRVPASKRAYPQIVRKADDWSVSRPKA
jgi:hypothetical protein